MTKSDLSTWFKWGTAILSIGIAWGTLMAEVKGTHTDMLRQEARTAAIEKFLITQSRGAFIPATQGSDPK